MSEKAVIAVLGYGSQGRAWALNLIDSGRDVIVGIPTGDRSRRYAKKDGITTITTISKAVARADIIIFAFPDHLHGKVYRNNIASYLKPGCTLIFLHALSIHFGQVIPPDNCDILLLAPLGPGTAVREKYLAGESIGYFYCIHQNATGWADRILKNMIKAMKIDRSAMIETTFADEAVGDLFGEQAVLCGGLTELIKTGYETLVKDGLSPDKAYLEVAYQLDLIIDLIKRYGIEGMYKRISVAARYGSLLTGPKIIDRSTKKRMKQILHEIKDGTFAGKLDRMTPDKIKKLESDLKRMTTPALDKSALKFSPEKSRKTGKSKKSKK
ncbi:MAG TPA: ketol-acid reductoisomerase [candidate division Zixibacteria bacterium]|nr:ketol-acid reductoisomerase [candidate division Zixibacteria bacterium]